MAARIGFAVFDALAPTPKIGWAEFDTRPSRPCVGWAEMDVRANPNDNHDDEAEAIVSGGRVRRTSAARVATVAKISPQAEASPYHSRAYEQDARAALDLDDEEITLAFLMELALHV
jgi:hypothetical protein